MGVSKKDVGDWVKWVKLWARVVYPQIIGREVKGERKGEDTFI